MTTSTKAIPVIETKNVRLLSAKKGSFLTFHVHTGTGFEATAILSRGSTTVASYETEELLGIVADEELKVSGQYQLQITCPYTSKTTSITIDLEVVTNGNVVRKRTVNFSGKTPDSARVIADVFVP